MGKIYFCEADKIESERRMQEIDHMREIGLRTESEMLMKEEWLESDIAFMVQRMDYMNSKTIGKILGRHYSDIEKKYRNIQKSGQIKFYKNCILPSLAF